MINNNLSADYAMNPIEKLTIDFLEKCKTDEHIKKYVEGRLDKYGNYTGWVGSKNLSNEKNSLVLELSEDNDQFLLYCLASAWSASGQWENAAVLIYTIKNHCPDLSSPLAWRDEKKLEESKNEAIKQLKIHSSEHTEMFAARKKATPRGDIYPAFKEIARKWVEIKALMDAAEETCEWEPFVHTLKNMTGLAPGNKCLNIKIPLILRELRCQKIYHSIPGELCCVPDQRVLNAIKYLKRHPYYDSNCGLKAYRPASARSLIASSKAIYKNFGDLYDLPLFSAADMYTELTVEGQ